jgi:hypothetical protein
MYIEDSEERACQDGDTLLDDSIALLNLFIPHMQVIHYGKSLWGITMPVGSFGEYPSTNLDELMKLQQ